MKIAGFLKAKDEIARAGNIYRALKNLDSVCDCGIVCDDGSMDGTTEALQEFVAARPSWRMLHIAPAVSSFDKELEVKQQMLQIIHQHIKPDWIFWLDADEVLDAKGTVELRQWLQQQEHQQAPGYRMHYTNLWRSTNWARTDDGFDAGSFIKLWRYQPNLAFEIKAGTHHNQFPAQAASNHVAPFEVIHYGNVGCNLKWKGIQYSNGRGGVDRHIAFGHTVQESLATGVGYDLSKYSIPDPQYREVPAGILPSGAESIPGPR